MLLARYVGSDEASFTARTPDYSASAATVLPVTVTSDQRRIWVLAEVADCPEMSMRESSDEKGRASRSRGVSTPLGKAAATTLLYQRFAIYRNAFLLSYRGHQSYIMTIRSRKGTEPAKLRQYAAQSPYTLRVATTADAEAISTLVAETWYKHFGPSVPQVDYDHYRSTALSPTFLAKCIQNPEMIFLLAENESKISGMTQLVFDTREPSLTATKPCELRKIYVDGTQQGSGLGKILIKASEGIARDEGCDGFWLGVWEDNSNGIRFYTGRGFKVVGTHDFVMGGSIRTDHIMEKPL